MNFSSLTKLLGAAVIALTAAGCDLFDSDDSSPRTVEGANLTIAAIDANNLNTYQMDDSIHLDYQLHVQELNAPDVTIDFYLVHADSDNDEEIEEAYLV